MAVDFIHRTVGDFLADTTEGQAILKKAKFSEEEMLARVLKAGLVRCRMFLRDQLQSGTLSCLLSSTLKAFEDGFLELGECYLYTFDTIEEEFLVCAAELGFDEYVVSHLPTSSSTELQSFVFLRCCQTARFQPDDELSSRQHFLIRHFLDTGISFEAPNQSKGTESGSIVNRQTLNAAWFQYLLSALSWSTVRMNGNHGFTAELVLETCTKFIEAVASTNKTITAVFKWNSHYGNFDIPITMTTLQWHDRQPLSFIRNGLENFIVLEISGRELFESVLSRANKPHHTEVFPTEILRIYS
ncbi:hypothetical protein LMH87_006168 [Akanthomyces muscarius]|uniref:Uncharacterized protein n=1 Tax=Akanthomyces muscarius TaxID=2231603 RepID=A0A9W8QPT2_AKAMU|nr:hypothetical protein LMH87_006168 [Akanthomyces muscarius]KAJ4164496.1 hypothetical protein LMH87_006168 [Akanthomyces muscarius]